MPTLEFISKLRAAADNSVLVLTARHVLQAYDCLDTIRITKKTRFPDDVAVLPAPTIVLAISGVLDRAPVSPEVLMESQFAQHFLAYLRNNAAQLGLSSISDLYTDDDDRPKINLTSSRCREPFHPKVPVCVTLREIHLQYSWSRTKSKSEVEPPPENHLFSKTLSLPFRSLVDNVLSRFLTWHLVRRYPLVFGVWSQQLDTEVQFFPSIYRSIAEIAKRSPNASFRSTFKQLIKTMKRQHETSFAKSSVSLADYLITEDKFDAHAPDLDISNEVAFCLSMEKLYLDGMKRPKFKISTGIPMAKSDAADDDELSHDQSLLTSENLALQTPPSIFNDRVIPRPLSPFDAGFPFKNPFDFGDLNTIPGKLHIRDPEDNDFDFDITPAAKSQAQSDIEISDGDNPKTENVRQPESLSSLRVSHHATLDLDISSDDSDFLEQTPVTASPLLSPYELPTLLVNPRDSSNVAQSRVHEDVVALYSYYESDLDLDTDIESYHDGQNMQVSSLISTDGQFSLPDRTSLDDQELGEIIQVDSDTDSDLSVQAFRSNIHCPNFASPQRATMHNQSASFSDDEDFLDVVPLRDQAIVDFTEVPCTQVLLDLDMLSDPGTDLEIEVHNEDKVPAPELESDQEKEDSSKDDEEPQAFDDLMDFCEDNGVQINERILLGPAIDIDLDDDQMIEYSDHDEAIVALEDVDAVELLDV